MADREEGASESSSVRDDLLAAIREHEEPAGEVESTPDRPRDESGRFAPKEPKEDDTQQARAPDSGSQNAGGSPAEGEGRSDQRAPHAIRPDSGGSNQPPQSTPHATAGPELAAAPPAWSNSVKAKWPTLDPEIRAEILKREADVHRGFTKNDEERNFGKEMRQIVAPYEAIIRAAGGTIPGAVADVLNTAYILRTADPQTKAQTIAQVCQQYGIDLKLVAQPQGEVNPQVAALQQEIRQIRAEQTQRQQQERQQLEQQVLNAVETFGQDPKHPHFRAVSAHMGALMQAGEAKDMEQAYEMAVWARPDLRAQLLAAQTAQQTATQQTRQRTEKARAKAVSVRGGPGGYTPPPVNPNASVRESLMSAIEEVNSRI